MSRPLLWILLPFVATTALAELPPAAISRHSTVISSEAPDLNEAAARADYDDAIRLLRQHLASHGESLGDLLRLADLYQAKQQFNEGRRWLARAAERDPEHPEVRSRQLAQLARVAPEQAEPALRQLAAQHPTYAAPYAALGNLLASRQRWREALSAYDAASQLTDASAALTVNRAIALDHLGRHDAAAKTYRMAMNQTDARLPPLRYAEVQRRLRELETLNLP